MAEEIRSGAVAPLTTLLEGDEAHSGHLVQFYDGDAFLVDAVSRFIGGALEVGGAGVLILTPPHREGVEATLAARGVDLAAAMAQGRYVVFDAAATLSRFMVDGRPEATRFNDVVGSVMARVVAAHHPHVRAFGEMVALLLADDKADAAIRLERLWNDLGKRISFSLLCGYPIGGFPGEHHQEPFLRICGAHSHVIPAESYSTLTDSNERLRAITELQRKAKALETEAAGRKRAERSLRWQQRELSDFLENAVEGLHRLGPDGRVLWANKALLGLLGYAPEEYVGHHAAEFHADPAGFDELWRRLMGRETLYDHPATLRCKDGSVKHVLIHSNGLWDDGDLVHTRCFIRDVTEQKRLGDELRGRVDQLADMDRRKDEFLAMLGHELRNPLSAVRNAVVTARLDPSRRDRALDIARRQTDQLARLVDDLLDVARITQGRIRLNVQRVRFTSIVERAIETTRQLVEERAHALTLSLPADDIQVDADATRLEQVIVNLVSNAAKYTEPGGRIEVRVERSGSEAALRIRDNGIGIAPETLPRVFDLFAQGDRTLDRADGGLGIGLTIVRRLVELHGGRVEARSAGAGKGSEFAVTLPAVPAASDEAAEAAGAGPLEQRGTSVLLVEDNPDAAETLMMLLELLGHHVRVANDGVTALGVAEKNVPDVMLVDIGLPGIDGYEVARRIRARPQLQRVVLVALTGYGHDEDRQRAAAAGFDYHLVKPVEFDVLQDLVARLGKSTPGATPTLH